MNKVDTKKLPSHVHAEVIVKMTGISRRTFYSRVVLRDVRYIELFNSWRLYDVSDWNRKNDDYQIKL
jgi:hypothetical protein